MHARKRLAVLVPVAFSGVFLACLEPDLLQTGKRLGPCDGGACTDSGPQVVPDAGPDAKVVCAPGDVSGFSPKWKPPAANRGNCSNAQIQNFVDCYFGPNANTPACIDVVENPNNAVCKGCILSNLADPAYGPFIALDEDRVAVNVEGCVALVTNKLATTDCGAKAQAITQCRRAACEPTCPITTSAELKTYTECEAKADQTSCKSYFTASQCILTELQTLPAANCASGPTVADAAKGVVALFCGP